MRSSRSSSSASTRSISSLPDPEATTIPIFVKLLSGETTLLTLPSSTPITTLLQLLSLRTSLPPSTLRLHLAGKHLPPAATLASLSIPPSSTLTLSLPLLGGTAATPADPSPPSSASSTPTSSASSTPTPTSSSTPAPAPAPRKPRPQRCTHKACNAPAQRIIGDCGFCTGHFCARHRMLEDHRCAGLDDCKKESHERNKDRLEAERTLVVRGI